MIIIRVWLLLGVCQSKGDGFRLSGQLYLGLRLEKVVQGE